MESEQMELEEMQVSEQELEQEAQELTEEEHPLAEEKAEVDEEQQKDITEAIEEDRSSFIHGLSVGLGMGCIATFIIMWIVVFFSPRLPSTITYESLLSIFIYPLLYLLVIGLVALTAGIVREYYARK
jgi:fructose-specific phosphotransferase system IIC component